MVADMLRNQASGKRRQNTWHLQTFWQNLPENNYFNTLPCHKPVVVKLRRRFSYVIQTVFEGWTRSQTSKRWPRRNIPKWRPFPFKHTNNKGKQIIKFLSTYLMWEPPVTSLSDFPLVTSLMALLHVHDSDFSYIIKLVIFCCTSSQNL